MFGGKDRLVDLFDSILWSAVSLGRMEDPAASYLSAVDENDTLFTLEQAAAAAEQFSALIRDAVPQEALDWTEDQAIEAFASGQAIALLAGQDRLEDIAGAMEEVTWGVAAIPGGPRARPSPAWSSPVLAWRLPRRMWQRRALPHLPVQRGQQHPPGQGLRHGAHPHHRRRPGASLEKTGLSVNLLMVRRADWYFYAQEPLMYRAQEAGGRRPIRPCRRFLAGEMTQQELLASFDGTGARPGPARGSCGRRKRRQNSDLGPRDTGAFSHLAGPM